LGSMDCFLCDEFQSKTRLHGNIPDLNEWLSDYLYISQIHVHTST